MHTVSGTFHSPSGVLFTFPSRYWFTIGRTLIFSLGEWSPQIPTGFHVPGGTQEPFQAVQLSDGFLTSRPHGLISPTTRQKLAPLSFGLFPVRSPLLRESLLIS